MVSIFKRSFEFDMGPSSACAQVALFVLVTCICSWEVDAAVQQCGKLKVGDDQKCAGDGLCCSQYGYCGTSTAYCGAGCQNGFCTSGTAVEKLSSFRTSSPAPRSTGLGALITEKVFDELYPDRNRTFYSYKAFITAANAYPTFGTTGGIKDRWREIAAFSAHLQQETAGLYWIEEIDKSGNYCDANDTQYPCAPGQLYYGRGPIQLSWNYNYGAASASVGVDILTKPYLVAQDPILSIKTAFWFWTTGSGTEPSCHDAILGRWTPSSTDVANGRLPGFGITIDIVNGGLECGKVTLQAQNRVKYFKQFCKKLGVKPGKNLSCAHMKSF